MMNANKKTGRSVLRKPVLQKCKRAETEVLNTLSGAEAYPSIQKRSEDVGPQTVKDLRNPDVVEKVRAWIMPNTSLRNDIAQEEPTIPADPIKNDSKAPLNQENRHLWTWGALKNDSGGDNQLGDSISKPRKAEIKLEPVEEETGAGEQGSTEEDAGKLKKIIAKEKRLKLKLARMQWEKDNEIRERPQKPKKTQGDMFFVPVPENRTRPEEFKNNYSKYIATFEEKFRKKLSEKVDRREEAVGTYSHVPQLKRDDGYFIKFASFKNGISSDKTGRASKDIMNDAFYRLLAAKY